MKKENKNRKLKLLQLAWEGYRRSNDNKKWYIGKYPPDETLVNVNYRLFSINGKPLSTSLKATDIPPYLLEMIFSTHALGLDIKTHHQLKGEVTKSPSVNISIDVSRNKTQIRREVMAFIEKIQAIRKDKGLDKKPDLGKKKGVIAYKLRDFDVFDECEKWKKKNGHIPFHKIARKKLGKKEISPNVDKKAKNLKHAYERAKWLKNGGYKALLMKS